MVVARNGPWHGARQEVRPGEKNPRQPTAAEWAEEPHNSRAMATPMAL